MGWKYTAVLFLIVMTVHPALAAILTVDDSGGKNYTNIQAAVNASKPGDIISVYPGNYTNVSIFNKNNLQLIGINTPNIVSSSGPGIYLRGNTHFITINGFEIRANGATGGQDTAIRVDPGYDDNVTDINISNCSLYANGGGGVCSATNNLDSGHRFHLKNLYIYTQGGSKAAESSGVIISDSLNSTAENLTIYAAANYSRLPIGLYAFGFTASDMDYIKNIHIYSCAGPAFFVDAWDANLDGIYVHDGKYPHNAIQPKGHNSTWNNTQILGQNSTWNNHWGGAVTPNCFYSMGYDYTYNQTYKNLYMNDTQWDSTVFGGHQNNTLFENVTIFNHTGSGLYIKCVDFNGTAYPVHTSNNTVVKNATINLYSTPGAAHPIKILCLGTSLYGPSERFSHNEPDDYIRDYVTYIDLNISGNITNTAIGIYNNGATAYGYNGSAYFINSNRNDARYYSLIHPECVISATDFFYYATIEAVYENNTPCSNGILFFETNTTHDDYEDKVPVLNTNYVNSSKGCVDEITSAPLDQNGKSYLPNHPEYTVCLPYSTQNKSIKKYVNTTIKCIDGGLDSPIIFEPVAGFIDRVIISSDGRKLHSLGNYAGNVTVEVNKSFYRKNPLDDSKSPRTKIIVHPLAKTPINVNIQIKR